MQKNRLDQQLVDLNIYRTRSRARDAVLRGAVSVNGTVVTRPSQSVSLQDRFDIEDAALDYVSRAALKLKAGLAATGYDTTGCIALDLGASTGGFTQVLLEAGCRHVFAVDVGHGQIDPRIGRDGRVTSLEGVNARSLTWDDLGGEVHGGIDCVVSDLSFISLKLALPPALSMVRPGGWGIFLVKPQFELGREHVGKGGIVRDRQEQDHCAMDLAKWLDRQTGWRHTHILASPIEGGSGNREFLLGGIKDAKQV